MSGFVYVCECEIKQKYWPLIGDEAINENRHTQINTQFNQLISFNALFLKNNQFSNPKKS